MAYFYAHDLIWVGQALIVVFALGLAWVVYRILPKDIGRKK